MELLIIILIIALVTMIHEYKVLYETNKITYNNYKQCLRALSESDPELKAYLESKGILK